MHVNSVKFQHFSEDQTYSRNKSILTSCTVNTTMAETYHHPLLPTGNFTAPVAGVYYFTVLHHAGGDHGTELGFYKNSWRETAHNGENAAFLQLQRGDKVCGCTLTCLGIQLPHDFQWFFSLDRMQLVLL